jgi:PAS domain S-box-containing protein
MGDPNGKSILLAMRKKASEALAASELRYRRLFESAQDGILILDAETGRIADVNPYLIRMLGFSKPELLEKAIWEIGIFKDVVASKENFAELQQKEYIRYEDLPLETADGRKVEVEFVSNVYMAGDRRVIQCDIRDITDRKEAERAVQRLLDEKSLLLKEVHHRIKNNMSTIVSLLGIQARSLPDSAAVKALDDAGSRVRTMMVLYEKLYQSVGFDSLSIRAYLPSLVDEILANFPSTRSLVVEKEIDDFELETNKLLPLGIIVNELLTNVMKYAFEGRDGGRIKVTASLRGSMAIFSIQDDGKGMPEGLDFDNSSGFGLQLVSMLSRQLKGRIGIERGGGTKITLEFEG